MVGYAVGEVPKPVAMGDDTEEVEVEQRGVAARWRSLGQDCYEIVTAWVHPRSVVGKQQKKTNTQTIDVNNIAKTCPVSVLRCPYKQLGKRFSTFIVT